MAKPAGVGLKQLIRLAQSSSSFIAYILLYNRRQYKRVEHLQTVTGLYSMRRLRK